jgi:4-methylaminobutanoate oxidase (formaldehyde-forming)
MDPDLPVIEDPDNYGYYRPEGDGMLVGLFEPVGKPWSLDGVARDFSFGKLPPDWERMEQFLGPALARIPCLAETGVRTFLALLPVPWVDLLAAASGMRCAGGGAVPRTAAGQLSR